LETDVSRAWSELLNRKLGDLPIAITCRNCGEGMELLRINDRVAFWVHKGKQLEKCKFMALRTTFAKDIGKAMVQMQQETVKKLQVWMENQNVQTSNNGQ